MASAGPTALGAEVVGHEFAVTEGGAASISVPVQVPRGIGGMEPQLGLSYTSQSGNGLLGVGWTLTGPSSVSRCGQTRMVDGVNKGVNFRAENDRFCMDGQRLILASGTYGAPDSTYKLQRDNFSSITASGTAYGQANVPSSFKVETKSGLVLEFGRSENSQVRTNLTAQALAAGRRDTINRWMLERIGDLHGNYIQFVYCGGQVVEAGAVCSQDDRLVNGAVAPGVWSGSKVLHYVQYTSRINGPTGTFGVIFDYETRPDIVQVFHEGSSARQKQRLKAIQVHRNFTGTSLSQRGNLVRKYLLDYQLSQVDPSHPAASILSRISGIREIAENGESLPRLSFSLSPAAPYSFDNELMMDTGIAKVQSAGSPSPSATCGGLMGQACP
jgi:hypothetical protein